MNNSLNFENNDNKENINNNNQLNSYDNYKNESFLEYSKNKLFLENDFSLISQNKINNDISNISIPNQNHRQISYHSNKSSIKKQKKEEEIQNEEYNNSSNKTIINNNEIVFYNKNYLAGNNSPKEDGNNYIVEKNNNIQRNLPINSHTQGDLNNIQIFNSITNKTSSINKKIFNYTSPNINKNPYKINIDSNNNNKENKNVNNNINNNNIFNKNQNINKLNRTNDDFYNINDDSNSQIKTIKDKSNIDLGENNNNNNSKFNIYYDIIENKNEEKDLDTINKNNNSKKDKNISKIGNKLRNTNRNTFEKVSISSLTNNIPNPGKQSLSSILNNKNMNASNIFLNNRNSNASMNQSNNLIKNIPINMLLRLRDWLISCDLLCYYNLLIENNMYDIDKCINEIQNNILTITYKDIENIGIKKPGHIFRLLLKLDIDSGTLDNNLFNYILYKFNKSSSIPNNIILTSSVADIKCCGICKNQNYKTYIKRNDCPYSDIISFLKYKGLWKYKENFLHNGFDQLEYILLQLFSKYTYDKELLDDCLHIYNEKEKLYVLKKLYQEKNSIAVECGINNDETEINQILSDQTYSSKYSSKKNKNNNDENKNFNNENDYCFIF